jgi:hypothetical protein
MNERRMREFAAARRSFKWPRFMKTTPIHQARNQLSKYFEIRREEPVGIVGIGSLRNAGMDCRHPGPRDASANVYVNLGPGGSCRDDEPSDSLFSILYPRPSVSVLVVDSLP